MIVNRARTSTDILYLWPLIQRAFKEGPIEPHVAVRELARFVTAPTLCVLVASDAESEGLAIVTLPSSPLFPLPQVYHFYSNGPLRLTHALTDAVVAWVRSQGYNGLQAANWTGREDTAWQRLFRRAGSVDRIGSLFRIDF